VTTGPSPIDRFRCVSSGQSVARIAELLCVAAGVAAVLARVPEALKLGSRAGADEVD
jgi:hypothetical protein